MNSLIMYGGILSGHRKKMAGVPEVRVCKQQRL